MTVLRVIVEVIFGGLLRGWPGVRCPNCSARPQRPHRAGCPTGAWDGGTWS